MVEIGTRRAITPPSSDDAGLPALIEAPPSLSKAIYHSLRQAILSGALKPGQVLRQQELAQRFCSSRVPLREALNHLEAEGLVASRPNRGYAVVSLDTKDVLDALQLRMIIEEHAGYVATLARTGADVDGLGACLGELETLPTKMPNEAELDRWWSVNQKFHDLLFGASGRRFLCQLSSNVRAQVAPYLRLEVSMTNDFEEAQADHRDLFAAFARGDAAKVGRLSRRHCERTALRLFRSLHARGLARDVSLAMVTDAGSSAPHETLRPRPAAQRDGAKRQAAR